jgi:uncharacterized membrane protein YdjX (TVP38/TMEM64 family)
MMGHLTPRDRRPPRPSARWHLRLPRALAAAVLGAACVAVLTLGPHSPRSFHLHGPTGMAIFIAITTALSAGMFPFPLTAAAAGLLFGTVLGTGAAVVSTTLGALAALAITRSCVGPGLTDRARGRAGRILRFVDRRGFVAVLYLRIVPGLPRGVLNFVLGLTSVSAGSFATATALGSAPRAFAYASLGASDGLSDLTSTTNVVALAALVLLALGPPVIDRAATRYRTR